MKLQRMSTPRHMPPCTEYNIARAYITSYTIGQYLSGSSSTRKGTCRTCSNVNCASGKYRSGSCSGTTNGYGCNTCSNLNCASGKYRSGSCSGTTDGYRCYTCSNLNCVSGKYRSGSCSGTTDGYRCITCSNLNCNSNQYKSGSCSGTTNGFKCNTQPSCSGGKYNPNYSTVVTVQTAEASTISIIVLETQACLYRFLLSCITSFP